MSEQITEGELLIRDVFRAIDSAEDDVPLVAFALGAAEVNLQLRDMRQLAQELATALDNLNWLHGAIKNTNIRSRVMDALAHAADAGLTP
jgi:hypothetical protein